MRIAIVTPYSWTYPGGVNRHVEALAEALIDRGHELRVLAPWDPPDRLSRAAPPRPRRAASPPRLPDPARTHVGFGANGAVSNLSSFPGAVITMRRELHAGRFDVVHVHEPPAPMLGWDACSFPARRSSAPSTPTRPSDSRTRREPARSPPQVQPAPARIAVSEAAAWTGRRWFGGEYRIIPNGVDIDAPPLRPKPSSRRSSGCCSSAAPRSARACPFCCRRSRGWSSTCPPALTVIGAEPRGRRRYVADPTESDRALRPGLRRTSGAQLHEADVLCAPSLAGESFGMVLTEAFAAGTPVIASEIAGYSDVVTDGPTASSCRPPTPSASPRSCSGSTSSLPAARRWGAAANGRALRVAAGRRAGRGRLRAGQGTMPEAGHEHQCVSPGEPDWCRSTAVRGARPTGFPRSTSNT